MIKNNIFKFTLLKKRCVELRGNYQIPYKLYKIIMNLDNSTTKEEIQFLISLTEIYLRVKGFYKKYKDFDDIASNEVLNLYENFKKGVH